MVWVWEFDSLESLNYQPKGPAWEPWEGKQQQTFPTEDKDQGIKFDTRAPWCLTKTL